MAGETESDSTSPYILEMAIESRRRSFLLLHRCLGLIGLVTFLVDPAIAQLTATLEPAQIRGDTPATSHEFSTQPLLTVGETVFGYTPVGSLDGIGALPWTSRTVRVFVNHEIGPPQGTPYQLENGLELRGARISFFDIDSVTRTIEGAGLAYHTVVDRGGAVVSSATQINEGTSSTEGFERFCSSSLYRRGDFGLVDDIYFCGEETHAGQVCALDVRNETIYVVPQLGRLACENVALVRHPDPMKIAILSGDDREGTPLWLYVGTRHAIGDGSFLDRNGLASGALFVWKEESGDLTPEQFHGTGSVRSGSFVALDHFDPAMPGEAGWDAFGYASQSNLDAQAEAVGAFQFSRPEDLSANPENPAELAFVSTGEGDAFPADNWGDTYIAVLDFSGPAPSATLRIAYDGDDAGGGQFADPDFGLRSPDNIDWSRDGFIYIQENRATSPSSLFGGTSGIEASIWKLAPASGRLERIAEMDRSAVPSGQTDASPSDLGNWESSGIVDVTPLFLHGPDETVLLIDTQASSLRGPSLDDQELVKGGQLLFLSTASPSIALDASDCAGLRVLRSVVGWSPASFELSLPIDAPVVCRIHDLSGRVVRKIQIRSGSQGGTRLEWHGDADDGSLVAGGVYFARIQANGRECATRVLVIR